MTRNNDSTQFVVILFTVLQLLCVVLLWTNSSVGAAAENILALFLGADLIAFSLVSYTFRTQRNGGSVDPFWLVIGCTAILLMLFSSLVLG
ncbi:MAG: hypothetical protein JRN52_03720 [Nitrososphaerota archaeon]|nr:hypothetical protein [Nitrososphaerota archaeon]